MISFDEFVFCSIYLLWQQFNGNESEENYLGFCWNQIIKAMFHLRKEMTNDVHNKGNSFAKITLSEIKFKTRYFITQSFVI